LIGHAVRTPTRLGWAGLLALAAASTPAAAQPAGRGVPTLTRYVQQFGQLERELAGAQAQRDAAALDRLVSGLFELRGNDAQLVPREDWLQRKVAAGAAIEQLAVHETGDQAVASFVRRESSGAATFVVDVWSPQPGGSWQLRLRFESPAARSLPPRRRVPDGKG
jgi:hypothetical protein